MCKFKNKTLPTPFLTYFTSASNFYNFEIIEIQKKEITIFPKATKNLLKDQLNQIVEQTLNLITELHQ